MRPPRSNKEQDMADAKNALGEEILVDPGTPEKDRAKHPSGLPEKEADKASGTTIADAESNDPPIRTNRPDVDDHPAARDRRGAAHAAERPGRSTPTAGSEHCIRHGR
jgi:hypothetical protein